MDVFLANAAALEESDEEDWAVCMDGEGRIDGSVGACDTSVAVWDQLLRLRDGTPALAALRAECQLAAWPLASGSFWMPADAEPTCPLERLALSIFRLHTSGRPFDRARSGAEWWANVTRSETVRRTQGSYGDIAVHLDKDEDAYSRYNLLVHPALSTVTYLSDAGAPTLVLPGARLDMYGEYPAEELPSAVLVPPAAGRHLCFDGRLLHGAPACLCEGAAEYERVTFCVNVWIHHAPGRLRRFGHGAPPTTGASPPPPLGLEPEPEPLRQHRLRLSEARRECAVARRQLWAGRAGGSAGVVHSGSGGAGAGVAGGADVEGRRAARGGGGEDEPALEFVLEQTATPHVLRLPHPPRLAAHLASSQRPVDVHFTAGCHIRPAAEVAAAAAAPAPAPAPTHDEAPLNAARPASAASMVRPKRRKLK